MTGAHVRVTSNFAEEQVWQPLKTLVSQVAYLKAVCWGEVPNIESVFDEGIPQFELRDSGEEGLIVQSNVGEAILYRYLQLRDNLVDV